MPIDYKKTGYAISQCRQAMGLSQKGLAALMNVTHQAVSKWENGVALPDTPTLLAMSKLFAVSMEDLLMGETARKTRTRDAFAQAQEQNEAQEPEETEAPADGEEQPEEEDGDEAEAEGEERDESDDAFEAFDVLEEEEGFEEIENIDLKRVQGMLPFVSTRVADGLFAQLLRCGNIDVSQLASVAPFVSSKALNDCVMQQIEKGIDQEQARKCLNTIAPFLASQTLDALLQGNLREHIDAKLAQSLLPFASTKTADMLAMRALGMKVKAAEAPREKPGAPEKKAGNDIWLRIALKAVEDGNEEWLEEHAEDLSPQARAQIWKLAVENEQEEIQEILLESMGEDEMKACLEGALARSDWELIKRISECL